MGGDTVRRRCRGLGQSLRGTTLGVVFLLLLLVLFLLGGVSWPGETLHVGAFHERPAVTEAMDDGGCVAAAADPNGGGWDVDASGQVSAVGNAPDYGDLTGVVLNRPIVGMASTPDGGGYWLVASDGGVFAFGDAEFEGSGTASGNTFVALIGAEAGYYLIPANAPWQFEADASHSSSGDVPIQAAVAVAGNKLIDSSGSVLQLRGVDISDTDTACLYGWGMSRVPLDLATVEAMAQWKINAVRIPINEDCWLGINGVPSKYSGSTYQNAIEAFVKLLTENGFVAIIDLHLTAPASYLATEEWPLPDEDHSPAVWHEIASAFAGEDGVIFDLFNEPDLGGPDPDGADWACWESGCTVTFTPTAGCGSSCGPVTYSAAGMAQLVDIVREAGATQPIMLSGLANAHDLCTGGNGGGGACSWLEFEPNDPLKQLIASFHSYGNGVCNTQACWQANVGVLSASVPVVTAEVGEFDCSGAYVQQYMNWANALGVSYLSWSWQTPTTAEIAEGCGATSTSLLSNWDGIPNDVSPIGETVKNEFEMDAEKNG